MQNCSALSYIFTLLKFQSPYLGGGGKKKKSVQFQGKTAEVTERFLGMVNGISWNPWHNNQFSLIVQ